MFLTPPDIIILLILTFFILNGFRHGFIEEMRKIISLIGGFVFASKFHRFCIPFIEPIVSGNTIQITISYLLIFIISVILINIIFKTLQKFIELALLGWLNRLLGSLLGLLKGFLIISLFMFIFGSIPLNIDKDNVIRHKLENESIMYQICSNVKEFAILTIPMDNQLDIWQNKLNEISKEKNNQLLNKP